MDGPGWQGGDCLSSAAARTRLRRPLSEVLLLPAQVQRLVTAFAFARPDLNALAAAAFAGGNLGRQVLHMRRLLAGGMHGRIVIGGTSADRREDKGAEGGAEQGLQEAHGGSRERDGLAIEFNP
ncbi:hypothetical protein D3C73_1047730 [compost metagenome]